MNRLFEYYEVSGGSDVITSGYPDVFHFDPSTYYNYTTDNYSTTSLEERFDYLAQGLGFPGTSTYSGITYLISSTATPDSDSGIFSSVQDAVDFLPRILDYPVNIEIADYGALGALNLQGLRCEGDGAIQIHCLNYASDNQAVVSGISVYGDISAVSSVKSDVILDSLTGITDFRTSTSLFDATSWKDNGRAFGQVSPDSQHETQVLSFASQASATQYAFSSASNVFIVEQYTQYSATYDKSLSIDVDPENTSDSTKLTYKQTGSRN